jgi:hypothetical protein
MSSRRRGSSGGPPHDRIEADLGDRPFAQLDLARLAGTADAPI